MRLSSSVLFEPVVQNSPMQGSPTSAGTCIQQYSQRISPQNCMSKPRDELRSPMPKRGTPAFAASTPTEKADILARGNGCSLLETGMKRLNLRQASPSKRHKCNSQQPIPTPNGFNNPCDLQFHGGISTSKSSKHTCSSQLQFRQKKMGNNRCSSQCPKWRLYGCCKHTRASNTCSYYKVALPMQVPLDHGRPSFFQNGWSEAAQFFQSSLALGEYHSGVGEEKVETQGSKFKPNKPRLLTIIE